MTLLGSEVKGKCPECGAGWRMYVRRQSGYSVICTVGHEYQAWSITKRLNGPITVEIGERVR